MPITVSELIVRFGADLSNYEAGANTVTNSLGRITNRAIQAGNEMASAFEKADKAISETAGNADLLSATLSRVGATATEEFSAVFSALSGESRTAMTALTEEATTAFNSIAASGKRAMNSVNFEKVTGQLSGVSTASMTAAAGVDVFATALERTAGTVVGVRDVGQALTSVSTRATTAGRNLESAFERGDLAIKKTAITAQSFEADIVSLASVIKTSMVGSFAAMSASAISTFTAMTAAVQKFVAVTAQFSATATSVTSVTTATATASTQASTFVKAWGGLDVILKGLGQMAGILTVISAGSAGLAADFNRHMLQIANNTTMGDEGLKAMKATILNLSNESGSSLNDLADGYMHVANFIQGAADRTLVLSAANKSAVATGADLAGAADVLGQGLHEFGISATEMKNGLDGATRTMNVFHLAAAQGNTTLNLFDQASNRALGVAANFKVPMTDAAAAMSALSQHGYNAAQAATQVMDIMVHISAPTKEAQKNIDYLSKTTGVNLTKDFTAAGLAAKGISGVLEDVSKVTGKNNTALVQQLIPALRGGLGAFTLIGTGAKDYTKFLHSLNDAMEGRIDPTQKGYNDVMATTAQRYAVLVSQVKNELIPVGTALLPVFENLIPVIHQVAEAIIQAVGAFSRMPQPVQNAVIALGAFNVVSSAFHLSMGSFPDLLGGKVIPILVRLIAPLVESSTALGGVGVAATGTGAAVGGLAAAFPPLLVILAAVAAEAAFLYFSWKNDWGGIREETQSAINWMTPFLNSAVETMKAGWQEGIHGMLMAYIVFSDAMKAVGAIIAFGFDQIRMTWNDVSDAVRSSWNLFQAEMIADGNKFVSGFVQALHLQPLIDEFDRAFIAIKSGMHAFILALQSQLGGMDDVFGKWWSNSPIGKYLADVSKQATLMQNGLPSWLGGNGQSPDDAGNKGDYAAHLGHMQNVGKAGSDAGQAILAHLGDAVETPAGQQSCAYFASMIMQSAGIEVPLTGGAKALRDWASNLQDANNKAGKAMSQAKPGDLIAWNDPKYGAPTKGGGHTGYHVGIYAGNNMVEESSGIGPHNQRIVPMYNSDAARAFTIPNRVLVGETAGLGNYVGAGIDPAAMKAGMAGQAAAESAAKKAAREAATAAKELAKHYSDTVNSIQVDIAKLNQTPVFVGKKMADDSKLAEMQFETTSGSLKGVTDAEKKHLLALASQDDTLRRFSGLYKANATQLQGLADAANVNANATEIQKQQYAAAQVAIEMQSGSLKNLTQAQKDQITVQEQQITTDMQAAAARKLLSGLHEREAFNRLSRQQREVVTAAGGQQEYNDLGAAGAANFAKEFADGQLSDALKSGRDNIEAVTNSMKVAGDSVTRAAIQAAGGIDAWNALGNTLEGVNMRAQLKNIEGLGSAVESLAGQARTVNEQAKDALNPLTTTAASAQKQIDNLLATDQIKDPTNPAIVQWINSIMTAAKAVDLVNLRKEIENLQDGWNKTLNEAKQRSAGTFNPAQTAVEDYLVSNRDQIRNMMSTLGEDGPAMLEKIKQNIKDTFNANLIMQGINQFHSSMGDIEHDWDIMRARNPFDAAIESLKVWNQDANGGKGAFTLPQGWNEQMAATVAKAKEAMTFAKQASDGINQLFGDLFTNLYDHGFKGLFNNIRTGFQKLLFQMATSILQSQLSQSLNRVLANILNPASSKGKKDGSGVKLPDIPTGAPIDTAAIQQTAATTANTAQLQLTNAALSSSDAATQANVIALQALEPLMSTNNLGMTTLTTTMGQLNIQSESLNLTMEQLITTLQTSGGGDSSSTGWLGTIFGLGGSSGGSNPASSALPGAGTLISGDTGGGSLTAAMMQSPTMKAQTLLYQSNSRTTADADAVGTDMGAQHANTATGGGDIYHVNLAIHSPDVAGVKQSSGQIMHQAARDLARAKKRF